MSATGKYEAVESTGAWRLSDRIGLAFCWFLGLLFCAIAAAIVIYMLVKGIQYVRPELLTTSPTTGFTQAKTGGFLDPLIGTFIVALIGIAIALPLGIAIAVWLSEFGRPFALAGKFGLIAAVRTADNKGGESATCDWLSIAMRG